MFPNQNNPNNNKVNVNTNIKTFYSDSCSLNISCWNDKISFRWAMSIGKDANGYTQYDRMHAISTAMNYSQLCALEDLYEKRIKPVKDSGENPEKPIYAPVPLQNGNVVYLAYQMNENGVPTEYFNLYKKDNASTTSFTFDTITSVVDFDPATGSGTVEEKIPADFKAFMKILDNVTLMLPIVNHAKKLSAAYTQALGGSQQSDGGFTAMNPPVDMNGANGEFPFYN